MNHKCVTQDDAYGALPIPTYNHKIFKGWYSASEDGTEVTEDSAFVTQNLYAVWEDEVILTLNYPSLSFEDEILYNVYYSVTEQDQIAEMGLLTFDSKLADGTIDNAILYANSVLSKPTSSAKAKALVVAMLNYGAAAQEQFGYKTDGNAFGAATAVYGYYAKAYFA